MQCTLDFKSSVDHRKVLSQTWGWPWRSRGWMFVHNTQGQAEPCSKAAQQSRVRRWLPCQHQPLPAHPHPLTPAPVMNVRTSLTLCPSSCFLPAPPAPPAAGTSGSPPVRSRGVSVSAAWALRLVVEPCVLHMIWKAWCLEGRSNASVLPTLIPGRVRKAS